MDQNEVENIYIDDEDVIQETYKAIFMGDPTLPKPPSPEPDEAIYKTIFLVLMR